MRRTGAIRAAATLLLGALVASSAVPSSGAAAVTNAAIRGKRAEAEAASARLADLNDELELRVAEYDEAMDRLERTSAALASTEEALRDTEGRLAASQDVLAARVDAIYRGGGLDVIDVLLGTTSFEDLVTRIELLEMVSDSDARLVAEVRSDRVRVAESVAALESRRAEQAALREQAAARRSACQLAVGKQSSFLASLESEVKRLVEEERARQRRLAEERLRRALASASAGRGRTASGSPGASHPDALAAALRYVGVPYVWGGSSPSGFDCSGLTQYAYAQVGISIPRTSRSQYRIGSFIPAARIDRLEPGDLVFFGYGGDAGRIHHVGMYAGGGDYVHAPGTGDRVRVDSLTARIAERGDYVGGVRP